MRWRCTFGSHKHRADRPTQESMQEKRVLERSQGNCHMKAAGRRGTKREEDGRRDSKEHEKDPRNLVIKHSCASMANSDSATNKFS